MIVDTKDFTLILPTLKTAAAFDFSICKELATEPIDKKQECPLFNKYINEQYLASVYGVKTATDSWCIAIYLIDYYLKLYPTKELVTYHITNAVGFMEGVHHILIDSSIAKDISRWDFEIDKDIICETNIKQKFHLMTVEWSENNLEHGMLIAIKSMQILRSGMLMIIFKKDINYDIIINAFLLFSHIFSKIELTRFNFGDHNITLICSNKKENIIGITCRKLNLMLSEKYTNIISKVQFANIDAKLKNCIMAIYTDSLHLVPFSTITNIITKLNWTYS